MMEHGRTDRHKKGRAVAPARRETIPRNRPAQAMFCFMFHFDQIVPDPTDGKAPQTERIRSN
jgi:hypothetical protein